MGERVPASQSPRSNWGASKKRVYGIRPKGRIGRDWHAISEGGIGQMAYRGQERKGGGVSAKGRGSNNRLL